MGEPAILDSKGWSVPEHERHVLADRRHRYALVIPVINEGERIRAQLRSVHAAGLPVDVVVADGGSTDGAVDADFLRGVGVRALLIKTGAGRLSAQLRMAYAWCLGGGYDGIVTVDGNGKDNVAAVTEFAARLDDGYDYVQGSRYALGGRAHNTPWDRAIGNRVIHAPLLSLASGHWFTDTTNGFRGYSGRFLLDPRVAPFRSVFVNYELLFYLTVRAGQLGFRIAEIPVERAYPRTGAVPTRITTWRAKMDVLAQTIRAALGAYTPG